MHLSIFSLDAAFVKNEDSPVYLRKDQSLKTVSAEIPLA